MKHVLLPIDGSTRSLRTIDTVSYTHLTLPTNSRV